MKKIFILMMGLLFTASAVFASPNAKVEFATMNKADTQMLFGSDSVSAVTLSSDEMVATEGEWGSLFRALTYSSLWARVPANAPSYNGRVYGHMPSYIGYYSSFARRSHYSLQWNLFYR